MSDNITPDGTDGSGHVSAGSAVASPPAPPVPPAPTQAPGAFPGPRHGGERSWRSGGIFFGLMLVVIGVIALAGGFTSLLDLFRFWPLLIVFGGVAGIFHPRDDAFIKRFAEGLGAIAVGLVLLGNTLGYIKWTVWVSILSLWPLLVIAIGIELVGRGLHLNWVRALSNVVLILGLVYGVFVLQYTPGRTAFPFLSFGGAATTYADAKPREAGVTTGHATVKIGGTGLTLGAGDVLATIGGTAPASLAPKLTTALANGVAEVTVSEPGDHNVVVGTGDNTLDMTLDRSVKWTEIRFDVGAVSGNADLRDLQVERVVVNAGASDLALTIGNLADTVAVEVSGGAMSLTVRVPANAKCTVHATSGITDVRVPASFRRTTGIPVIGDSTFVSDGTGGPAIDIRLTSGVSDIRVETY